jgi:hypothetical protein
VAQKEDAVCGVAPTTDEAAAGRIYKGRRKEGNGVWVRKREALRRREGMDRSAVKKSKESEEYFYCTLVGTRRIGTLWWSPMVLQNTRVSKFTGGFADAPQHDEQVGFPPVV